MMSSGITPRNIHTTLSLNLPSPLQRFQPAWPGAENLRIFIKRDDLIHPIISGNKWRKLSAIFAQLEKMPEHIVSFGGGFSNHLHALGYICKVLNIPFTAIVRGNYTTTLTPMLKDLLAWQADIQYVCRDEYRKRSCPDYLNVLSSYFPNALIIPEGGSHQAALSGMAEMVREIDDDFDCMMVPVASGATLAGVTESLTQRQTACGIAVLKGQNYLESLVSNLLPRPSDNWYIDHRYHSGGYAKRDDALVSLCDEMKDDYGLAVEPVYSAKLFHALKHKVAGGEFAAGSRLIVIHTGGLQGARN